MSVVDILRHCETRLEKDAGLVINRNLNATLSDEVNMALFIKTGNLKTYQTRPPFEEEKRTVALVRELKLATPAELEAWGDCERDVNSRHFAMVRFLVGRAIWNMSEKAAEADADYGHLLFPPSPTEIETTVRIHIPCFLWQFCNPVTPFMTHWTHRRLCKAEMEAMACACIAYMLLGDIRVKSYTHVPSVHPGAAIDAINIDFVWLWEK